jgi:hypothetical protein
LLPPRATAHFCPAPHSIAASFGDPQRGSPSLPTSSRPSLANITLTARPSFNSTSYTVIIIPIAVVIPTAAKLTPCDHSCCLQPTTLQRGSGARLHAL